MKENYSAVNAQKNGGLPSQGPSPLPAQALGSDGDREGRTLVFLVNYFVSFLCAQAYPFIFLAFGMPSVTTSPFTILASGGNLFPDTPLPSKVPGSARRGGAVGPAFRKPEEAAAPSSLSEAGFGTGLHIWCSLLKSTGHPWILVCRALCTIPALPTTPKWPQAVLTLPQLRALQLTVYGNRTVGAFHLFNNYLLSKDCF